MLTSIIELKPRTCDEITRRRRHEHFARSGAGGHARADMHRDAARLFSAQALDFASVHARAYVEAESYFNEAEIGALADVWSERLAGPRC